MNKPSPWSRRHLDAVGESDCTQPRGALWRAGQCLATARVPMTHAPLPCGLMGTGRRRIRAKNRVVDPRSPSGDPNGAR